MAEILLSTGAAPSTPSLGRVSLYAKSDKYMYYKDDGGIEHSIGLFASDILISGVLSPAQITSNQNDYNPTGLATAGVLRLNSDASRNVTGLSGGQTGRCFLIHNVGTQNIVLQDENASSTAANRFALTADITLSADDCALLQYDSVSSRWRAIAKPPTAGSGITTLNSQVGATQSFAKVDDTNVTLTISSAANVHTFTLGWTGDLALSRLAQASAASRLLGRGSAAGAGDFQEIVLGTNLSMSGTTLNATGGGSGIVRSVNSIAGNTTGAAAAATDYVYICTAALTFTLPTAVGNTNLYTVKNAAAATVTINTTSSQTMDGSTSLTMPVQYTSLDFISDNANWHIV